MMATCPRCRFQYELDAPEVEPKTTGRGSQWNHVVGHAVQIGAEQGLTWREALTEILRRAITKGYPYKVTGHGGVVPKDYKQMTKAEASTVIEQEHEDAAFLGIALKEDKWAGGKDGTD